MESLSNRIVDRGWAMMQRRDADYKLGRAWDGASALGTRGAGVVVVFGCSQLGRQSRQTVSSGVSAGRLVVTVGSVAPGAAARSAAQRSLRSALLGANRTPGIAERSTSCKAPEHTTIGVLIPLCPRRRMKSSPSILGI